MWPCSPLGQLKASDLAAQVEAPALGGNHGHWWWEVGEEVAFVGWQQERGDRGRRVSACTAELEQTDAGQLPTCGVLQRGGAVALAGLNHLQQAGAARQYQRIEV